MKISILSTGSKGNCAILDNGKSKIMIDCGLPFREITTNRAFGRFADYEQLLITHNHQDHSKSLKEFSKYIDYINTDNTANIVYDLINWKIMPFEVQHDVKCYGYLVKDKLSNTNMLWATDFSNLPVINGAKIDIVCMECNYDEQTVTDKIINGVEIKSDYQSHNSLENLVQYLEKLPSKPRVLIMLHKSNEGNLNERLAVESVNNLVDKVQVAEKNTELEI